MTHGLTTSVDEALDAHTDESPARPGCYALEIDVPETAGLETLSRDWLRHYESTPEYLEEIVELDRCIYVGAAKNVRARLEDHVSRQVRKATLPTVWGVSDLITVWWFDSAELAFEREQWCADELRRAFPNAYVHAR